MRRAYNNKKLNKMEDNIKQVVKDVRFLIDRKCCDETIQARITNFINERDEALLIQRVSQRSEPLIDIHSYHGDLNGSCLTCGLPEGCHEL